MNILNKITTLTRYIIRYGLVFLFTVSATYLLSCNIKKKEQSKASTQTYNVAAYYWPAYHNEPRWQTFFEGNEGEWEIIRSSVPKYEGHRQPRIPLWGYEDESDPKVMEKKIDAAISHGVNIFIFDWYWYEGKPFLEECVNNGFLKAKNRNEMKFYIM